MELDVIQSQSLRSLVTQVNQMKLKKEDIVQILCADETWFLLYYK